MGVCQTKLPVSTSIELKSPKVFIKTSLLLLIIKESFCCDLINDFSVLTFQISLPSFKE